ncbi:phosphoribosylglycinamide formyltransferase [Anaerocolumna aminovalerica]|jgi:phosphoribosylglycinamide formyltransferase-1|uniref:Phosphoribosylglycinamide formyltransferase n=1 Tax=Anaerocolumna aminovalerica TaxID=1527 RepID=A0A1I5C630_9FIRM|nr:phosphoribosylglycinamide formyltransferase [Anaerocolumna aminovalerica]MBU5333129.1 phosphoribosylglycinamide formyltransferase [Anaerocolumna aminovalerica]MDU6263061.1 phosphoribosylglycinamide formyltransferase [Anaerocolumna aminovalerica]SFN82479.1 formyltetrahydrofolate-dependent phosphoribosylglycinamide formyltransferase [Anaerocolumna aminovalerica]
MLRIAVLVSGGGTNLQAIIDSMKQGKITNTEIGVVISNREQAYAIDRAKQYGINTAVVSPKDYENREEFNLALCEALDSYQVDLIVLAGYLVILPKVLIEKYPNKIINIHPSLIPSFCGPGFYGLRVHEAVLERGNKITGATVHFVDEGTDTGPIILQKAVPVREQDTPEILQKRVMEEAEWYILPEAINLIANNKIKINNTKVYITD